MYNSSLSLYKTTLHGSRKEKLLKFHPTEIIEKFDNYLNKQSLHFEAIVVGGTALSLLGVITRTTRDVDLLTSPIPPIILRHAKDFARIHGLADNWLNDAPQTLKKDLPKGWEAKTQIIYEGSALKLRTLERQHLIISKLYAACDRDADDLQDLLAMKPSFKEIDDAGEWIENLDGNLSWPNHVKAVVERLKKAFS